MKVRELIAKLQDLDDDDLEVHFAYNYGDYWKTTVAPAVEDVDTGWVARSEYHRMDAMLDDEDVSEDDPKHADQRNVVILR